MIWSHISFSSFLLLSALIFSCEGVIWRTNTFGIDPGSKIEPVQQSQSGAHLPYFVKNFGREAVVAYVEQSSTFSKSTRLLTQTVQPGQTAKLNPTDKTQSTTTLVIENKGKLRAIVQARTSAAYPAIYKDWKPFRLNIDISGLVKTVAVFGAGYIPVVGPVVSTMLGFFWPSDSADVWDEIKDKVKNLIDTKMNDLVENLLENKVRVYKRRISILDQEIKKKISKKRLSQHYMNIAQDLVGVEEDFRFTKKASIDYKKINYATLPIYSTVVSMKIMYYRIGMAHPEDYGLDEDEVEELKIYASDTLYGDNGAIAHINEVRTQREAFVYEHAQAENIYNEMANVKSYMSLTAEMYIDVWKNFIEHPKSTDRPQNHALIYSEYYGRPTGDLQGQGASNPPMQHLSAKLVNGTRPKIVKIEGHVKDNFVTGLKVKYKGGEVISTGLTEGTKTSGAGFGQVYIKSIIIVADIDQGGPIRGIVFKTNTDREGAFGTADKSTPGHIIKMDGYHMAGIQMSNDGPSTNKAWNIAITWQPDNPKLE